ncbi:hypothetical protein HKK55_14875 [Pseudomonas sp. ADAK18]|uniref:hypothetical protein n=1 Tax=Pseudomonas sp. ADAK18 TaxID=2730848 RepID=UPI0014628129|nr:hypothetical protein [Pseudomonas sp. ADAK18]QJI29936.1 hypothetical protein HKK55_14875 [Pseudomonas sp. ADAK18]
MNIDKEKLKGLLQAETTSWSADCSEWKRATEALDEFLGEKTVEEVALALLEENERLTENASSRAIRSLRGDCADLLAERDQLKAESESLRQSLADHKACIASDNELFREANLECNRYHSVIVAVGELLGISKEEQDEEEVTQEELIEAINELWGQVHGMQEDLDEYKSEHEVLRKNAERFQYWTKCWSREEEATLPREVEAQMNSNHDFEIEDAFDAAIGKGEQS